MATRSFPRLPTYFISHGGGPWPWIEREMGFDFGPLRRSLESIPDELGVTPRAVLAISGHWEEPDFTVQALDRPPMLYDYGGFPEFTYHVQYPAPGSPPLAARVAELLSAADIPVSVDRKRGFDHGVFAPFVVMYPDALVPIVQLSLKHGYDPAEHLAVGRALAPLRDEGVLIVGSGFSFHNLSLFGGAGAAPSAAFEGWLTQSLVEEPPAVRTQRLLDWEQAPSARASHPAEDHLVPLMVAVGAAEHEVGTRIYHEDAFMGSITSASYRFGELPAAATEDVGVDAVEKLSSATS